MVSEVQAHARGAGGPTLIQLRNAVKNYLKAHPDINTTVPQQLMSDAKFELIYTPPYVSVLQPIELIWAYTKGIVARQSHRTRTTEQATIQTREAMDKVNAELCGKVIEHCHKFIDSFIEADETGNLKQFVNLQTLKQAAKDQLIHLYYQAVDQSEQAEEEEKENEAPHWE